MSTEDSQLQESASPEKIEEIINDPNVEFIYANGFTFFVGNSDVGIILKTNEKPTKILNISFTLAKTLSTKLQNMIVDLEESTNNEIMTTQEISQNFLFKKGK